MISVFVLTAFSKLFAQDTITVQTFTFSDISNRRDKFAFPDTSHKFRKILMYYTLKCDPATTHDKYNCGEWDYLTYTYVYDHTGKYDSTLMSHPNFIVDGITPDTFMFMKDISWDYYPRFEQFIVYQDTLSQNNYKIAYDSTDKYNMQLEGVKVARYQFLWGVNELIDAGLNNSYITGISFNVNNIGANIDRLKIKIKHTVYNFLTTENIDSYGFLTVYDRQTNLSQSGWVTLPFTDPFQWDSSSNILIELCIDNNT